MAIENTPYETAIPFVRDVPGWMNEYDSARLASYTVYADMYNNTDGNTEAMLRGADDLPLYVPTARSLVNTIARYVGRGYGFTFDDTVGTPLEQETAVAAMQALFDREQIILKFKMAVKEMIKLGDAFWYITGDSSKPEGSRISIKTVDPALVFPITLDDDPDRVVGYNMVEQITVGDELVIQRQRWLKNTSPDHPDYTPPVFDAATGQWSGGPNHDAPVVYDKVTLEIENWESPDEQVIVSTDIPQFYFPKEIKQLPIYHWKNNPESGNPFGSSELRSIERLIAGINQSATDEDTTLALQGIGLYKTKKGGGPVDSNGNPTDWVLGPGVVVEDEDFDRVDGVKTTVPFQEHIKYLEEKADSVVGITDVTRGAVTAEVAESGVALSIRMAPTIDAATEKDEMIAAVNNQMLYDLRDWFKAFEGVDFGEVVLTTMFGDKIPRNRKDEIAELDNLLERKVISTAYYRQEMTKRFGYKFPKEIEDEIAADVAREQPVDSYAGRLMDESEVTDEGAEPVTEE